MGYINENTGEWTLTPPKDKKTAELKVKEYVGIDTPFPDDCKDFETLLTVVKSIDQHMNKKTSIDNKYILDSVVRGYITPKCVLIGFVATFVFGIMYLLQNQNLLREDLQPKQTMLNGLRTWNILSK